MIPEISSLYVDSDSQIHEVVCSANLNSDPVVIIKSKKRGSSNQVVTLEDFQNQFVKWIT